MSRNSIEKRSRMLEKSKINQSRCNPESSTSIIISPTPSIKQPSLLEQSNSTKNFPPNGDSLESRYLALKQMYKSLLEKVSNKTPNAVDQTKQLEKLRAVHEKNQKEIRMLRGMLGFLQKEDKSTQTESNNQMYQIRSIKNITANIKSCSNIPKYSCYASKDTNNFVPRNTKTSESQSQPKIGSPINNKSSMMKTTDPKRGGESWIPKSTKKFCMQHVKSQSAFNLISSKKLERCPSPGGLKQKYRFVPSLPIF